MTTQSLKSPTQILEELIRFRGEKVPYVEMKIFPEALVDLLDEKDNEIKRLKEEMLELLKKSIELSGGVNIS